MENSEMPGWPQAPEHADPPPMGMREPEADAAVEVGIVGAGIHGAALAREFTLRGIGCALIDRGDIGGGTSQWSSQLLHGGIRYLRTGDVKQMREGLRERATWVRIAPHRCKWEAFWMPHRGWAEGMMHRVGIWLYDHWGRNRPGWPDDLELGYVPGEILWLDPRMNQSFWRGAVAYADLMTWDRDLVRDLAASSEAMRFDFHDVVKWEIGGESKAAGVPELKAAIVRDRRDGTERRVQAKFWVMALGPWTDEALREWFDDSQQRLRLSVGIHLWFDLPAHCERPIAAIYNRDRVVFLIPRDGQLMVGTTEREVETGFAPITDADREQLFAALELNFPGMDWRAMPVRGEEAGVRPLVRNEGAKTSEISRGARLEKYSRFANVKLVLGGKLTTARELMDALATRISGEKCPESQTKPLRHWQGPGA